MSMWEIEALIEDSVRLISQSQKEKERKRLIIWNLYELQAQFDCSFTNFRVMPLLLENAYTKTIPIEAHPDFSSHSTYFETLRTKNFEFINVKIGQSWSADNPTAAYWDKKTNLIYYDLGSPLWEQLEKDKPQDIELYELGLEIIKEAHEQKNKNGVYNWTAFLINYGLNYFQQKESIAVLKEKYFKVIRVIFEQYDFTNHDPMHPSLEVLKTPTDWLGEEENEFIKWFNS